MPIAVVQVSDKYVGSGVNAPATFAMASTPGAGSTVLVFVGLYHGSNASITAVTVGGQSAVLDIARTAELSDASIWRIQSFSGANGTVSITDSNGFNLYVNAVAVEVTGLAADPLEGEATAGTTATTTDPIVLTAAAAPSTYPALFIGGFALTTSGTDNGIVTAQGTELYAHQNSTSDLGGAAAYELLTSAGAGELEWTRTNANGWQAVSAYYLGADGEGPGFGARDLIALAENNSPVSVPLVDESAGAGDAGGVPRLQADGKLHPSTYEAGGSPAEIVMEWDTPGTYSGVDRPDPAVYPKCEALMVGGGAGGGSGRRGAATEICRGGGGGGAGRAIRMNFRTETLAATFAVVVGAGGAGGAARTTDNTNGVAGSAGGNTQLFFASDQNLFSNRIQANGATGTGGGGTTTAGAGGGSQFSMIHGVAIAGVTAGASAATGTGATVNTDQGVPTGGGGGGTLTANTTSNFNGGSASTNFNVLISTGGTTASPNGEAGKFSPALEDTPSISGGGGGAAIHAAAGGNGGNGVRGSGGGGGGASRNGNNSGAGGNGGDGYVRLRFFR